MPFSPTGSSSRRVIRLRAHGERTGGESTAQGKASGIKNSTLAVLFFARTVRLGLVPARAVRYLCCPDRRTRRKTNGLPQLFPPAIYPDFRPYLSYFTPQALGFSCCIGNMQRYAILQIISLRAPNIRIFFRQNRSGLFPGLHLQLFQG